MFVSDLQNRTLASLQLDSPNITNIIPVHDPQAASATSKFRMFASFIVMPIAVSTSPLEYLVVAFHGHGSKKEINASPIPAMTPAMISTQPIAARILAACSKRVSIDRGFKAGRLVAR